MRRSAGPLMIVLLVMCLLSAACGPDVRSLAITPTEITIGEVGGTVQLDVEPRDKLGARASGTNITFRSRNPEVASVSAMGVVTAQSHGTTTIVVQASGTDLMEFVHVSVRIPEALKIRPANTTCYIGGAKSFKATVTDHSGKAYQNVHVDWSISDTSKAIISERGEVTGIDEGEVTVTAKALGLEGSSQVTIAWAPGQKAMIEAEKRFKARGGGRRGGRGKAKSGGDGSGWDPRLGMWDD